MGWKKLIALLLLVGLAGCAAPTPLPDNSTPIPTGTSALTEISIPLTSTSIETATVASLYPQDIVVYTDFESIYMLDLENRENILLANTVSGAYEFISGPSKRGTIYITYSGDTPNNTGDIYELNLQAKQLTRITNDTYADYYLEMSPNGDLLAYISDQDSPDIEKRYRLYILDTKNNSYTHLYESANELSTPFWSPDGRKVAFGEFIGQGASLRTADLADGKITKYAINFIDITWSPDSMKFAVSKEDTQNPGILILDAISGKIEQKIDTSNVPVGILWSPVDNKIIYQSKVYRGNDRYDEKTSLLLLDLAMDNTTLIQDGGIDGSVYEYHPLWSKDGKYVAYFIEPGTIKIWNADNGATLNFQLADHGFPADAVWFLPTAGRQ